jgi:two-component system, OmpR family, alkaline phosphatase synthesis response regulator PhoP
MPGTIVIIDNEPNSVKSLVSILNQEGYRTLTAQNCSTGLKLVCRELPTLVILDLVLPDHDGFFVLKHIRMYQQTRSIPIIILTGRNEEIDLILGLELGADAYMTQPFSPRELKARIKAVLRRCGSNKVRQEGFPELIGSGEVQINLLKQMAKIRGKAVELTTKEFNLLGLLLSYPGRVFNREFLLEFLWGYEYSGGTRTVDVHIRRLRKKIEIDPDTPVYIETIRNVGYRFSEPTNDGPKIDTIS